MPILLWLLFGIIQYSWFFYAMQSGTAAVGDATRRLSVGDCQTSSELTNLVKNKLGAALTNGTPVSTTVAYTAAAGGSAAAPGEIGGSVQLTATYSTMNMHFPLIPVPGGGTITRSVTARVEDTTATAGGCS
jgi:Flp pilus assembly protein TadG